MPKANITNELIEDLKRDEGCVLKAYPDPISKGEPFTIGYGHTGGIKPGMVWTKEKAELVLREDAQNHANELIDNLPWVSNLDQVRQDVLFNMAFNLGVQKLLKFKNTLRQIKLGNYKNAADMMLLSDWARQVKGRAIRLSRMMEKGAR